MKSPIKILILLSSIMIALTAAIAEEKKPYEEIWFISLKKCDLAQRQKEKPNDPLIQFFLKNQKDLAMSAKVLPKDKLVTFKVTTRYESEDEDVWVFNLSDSPIGVGAVESVPIGGYHADLQGGQATKIHNASADEDWFNFVMIEDNSKSGKTCVVVLNHSQNEVVLSKMLTAEPGNNKSLLKQLIETGRFQDYKKIKKPIGE